MTVPAPKTWVAAELVDEGDLNLDIRDTDNFLLAPPRCSVHKSADGSLANNTWGVIGFDLELYDPYTPAAHDNVTNNSRLVAAETGLYTIFAKIRFGSITSGAMDLNVRKNAAGSQAGGTQLQLVTVGATTGGDEYPSLTFDAQLNSGDYIEIFGRQSSGGTAPVVSGVGNTVLQFRWVSKL